MLKDEAGNMAIIVSLLAVPMMMAGGAAVDYGNWVSVQARLQAATDAAALAAGREGNLSDTDLNRIAADYFHANFGAPSNAGAAQMTMTISSSGKLRVDSEVTVENYLMKAAGSIEQTIRASAEVSKEATGLEVALVFDNTGSMASESRLSTLKVAAKDFVEILFGPRDQADTLKIAVVPFSQFVNVGPDKATAQWLDTQGRAQYSNANFSDPAYHNWQGWQDLRNRSWTGCVEARPGALATNDAAPDSSTPDTLFVPAFAPDEPSLSGYYNSYIGDGSLPSNATARQRQENQRKYRNASVSSSSKGPQVGCNIQPIQALTNLKAPVVSTINNMRADGYTHVAEGVAWGLRVLSPGEPFTEGVPYSDEETRKVMVLLTDGENTFDTNGLSGNINGSTYTAYGYLKQARLGSSHYVTAINQQNQLLQDSCNNVKAQDIVVYSFAYNVYNATQRNLIKNCASSPEKYFDPPSNAALVQSFQQIADELRRLHLSQ
jgi:Flp pilus assembly protein TadG